VTFTKADESDEVIISSSTKIVPPYGWDRQWNEDINKASSSNNLIFYFFCLPLSTVALRID